MFLGGVFMQSGIPKFFRVLSSGNSLRRRIAVSLAIVRLILVPVIFLSVYYLVKMDRIVDRIVGVNAPMATLAQRASVDFLEARRAERNYFLLHDQAYLQSNRDALLRVRRLLNEIRILEPNEHEAIQKIGQNVELYQQQFASAVALMEEPGSTPIQRVQEVVRAYERNLNDLLKRARYEKQVQLIEDLRGQVDSFDFEITRTVEAGDPVLRRVTSDLQISSQEVRQILSDLEMRGWARVEDDHEGTRHLVYRAEWVLSIVSGLTLLLSVWISFVLPRQVVKPLIELRTAVDQAVSGNYEIEFELQGEGELVNLARSIRNLISHARLTV